MRGASSNPRVRSRVEAWRVHGADACPPCEPDDEAYEPFVAAARTPPRVVSFSSPVSSNVPRRSGERLSVMARRLRTASAERPQRREAAFEEFSATQCGNPLCTVTSVNGKHSGMCIFPELPPRRAH